LIVLDSNVVSELMKPAPDDGVVQWVAARPPSSLFTTSITESEIFYGVKILADGRRRALEEAATAIFDEVFRGRVLAFGSDAARSWAEIVVARRRAGRPISQLDAQIAAIARSTGAAIATRNVADFADCGVSVLDPWNPV
jgi:toxin FitB